MRRTRFLIWKELIELRRDPRLFSIVIIAPILQLFMLAYAATTDVRNVPIVVADADRSSASRELISRFSASPSFRLTAVVSSTSDVDRYLEHGDARRFRSSRTAAIRILRDCHSVMRPI